MKFVEKFVIWFSQDNDMHTVFLYDLYSIKDTEYVSTVRVKKFNVLLLSVIDYFNNNL